jgi:anthranilate phosphoribosyltransferase
LLNPARPTAQLVGVPRPELCAPLARVLQSLGVRRAIVVSGAVSNPATATAETPARFLDEFSTLNENFIAEFYQGRAFATSSLDPSSFPLQPATFSELGGGDARTNARITENILRGAERGPKRDAVLLNAAAALFVAGKVKSLGEGWEAAARLIDRGKAAAKLDELKSAN